MLKRTTMIITLVFLLFGIVPGALGADASSDQVNTSNELTMQQAFDVALKNSDTIKAADYTIDSKEQLADSARQSAPSYVPTGSNTSSSVFGSFTNLFSANIAVQTADKAKIKAIDQLALNVYKDYTAVLKDKDNYKYAQDALRNAQLQWNVDMINYQLGMTSQVQKDNSQKTFEAAQTTLNTSKITLDMDYEAFNKLLGLVADDRPVLTDTPTFSPLVVANLESAIGSALASSPDIWSADQAVAVAKLSTDLYNYSSSTPYEVKANDYSIDSITAANLRDTLAQGIRDLYNSLMKLEQTYTTQQNAVTQAEDNLRVKQLMLEIGTATQLDVQTAELSLEKAKDDLTATVYTHEYSKEVFAKPWLAS